MLLTNKTKNIITNNTCRQTLCLVVTRHKSDLFEWGKSDIVTRIVGSNSSLVAPLTIEENSVIGAGSVITKNVKKNSLALTRSPQISKKYNKRKKK